MGEKGQVYEVERDRFAVMYSGPLEVGECIRVVPAAEVERLRISREALRDVIAVLRAYIAKPEGSGPLRLTEALALADEALIMTTDGVAEGVEYAIRVFERWKAEIEADPRV